VKALLPLALLLSGTLGCSARFARMPAMDTPIARLVEIARASATAEQAAQSFAADAALQDAGKLSPQDSRRWRFAPKTPVSARELAGVMGLQRAYLVSGDVHQVAFSVRVWTKDLEDPHRKRIATNFPKAGPWLLDARGPRPAGDLPGIAAGASPAYGLDKYDTPLESFEFWQEDDDAR